MNRPFRFSLLASVCLCAEFFVAGCENIPHPLAPGSFSTVVIDAGHGGKDSGEVHAGQREKDYTLDTALRLQTLLEKEGFHTVLTRSDDRFVELDDRVASADRSYPSAILVSIHYNANGPDGLQTYYWRSDSYGLAVRVQRHMIAETGEPHRGVIRRVLRLTHNPRVPSILCEGGYLDDTADASRIVTPEYRQSLAEGIADGIVEERERGDADIGPLPKVNTVVSVRPAQRHPVSSRRHHGTIIKARRSTSKHSTAHHSTTTTKKRKRKTH